MLAAIMFLDSISCCIWLLKYFNIFFIVLEQFLVSYLFPQLLHLVIHFYLYL